MPMFAGTKLLSATPVAYAASTAMYVDAARVRVAEDPVPAERGQRRLQRPGRGSPG